MQHIRGQSALDLLLSLIIVLIVLSSFSTILSRFDEVNREISLRQQLRENSSLITSLATYSSTVMNQGLNYPPTNSLPGGNLLQNGYFDHSRAGSIVLLTPIRSLSSVDSSSCVFDYDVNGTLLTYRVAIPASYSGLPMDVDINTTALIHSRFDFNHTFILNGCLDSFVVEAQ